MRHQVRDGLRLVLASLLVQPTGSFSNLFYNYRHASPRARIPICNTFSADFATACEAQLEVLSETLTQLSRAAVFARRENPADGALEFYTVAVWPVAQGVFTVGENEPAARAKPSLPGLTDASLLLPSYPFLPTEDSPSTPMEDGGLSVPLRYKSDVHGVLAIWRGGSPTSSSWSQQDKRKAERVARTLAVAAALDRASSSSEDENDAEEDKKAAKIAKPVVERAVQEAFADQGLDVNAESRALLLREVQAMLAASVHQLNSPLSAVRTLSKLLLRRLDDTTNRELARDILIQAERLSELVEPIDRLAISLPAAAEAIPEVGRSDSGGGIGARDVTLDESMEVVDAMEATLAASVLWPSPPPAPLVPPAPPPSPPRPLLASGAAAAATGVSDPTFTPPSSSPSSAASAGGEEDGEDDIAVEVAQITFVGDVLRPLGTLAMHLAPERGVKDVYVSLEAELPGVRAPEAAVREAVTNLIDNALKYADGEGEEEDGGEAAEAAVAIGCDWDEENGMIVVEVWNSSPAIPAEELIGVREWGARGKAAEISGRDGSGYGLPIAEQLVELLGGKLLLENAKMPEWAWERQQHEAGSSSEHGRPGGVSARILLPRAARVR